MSRESIEIKRMIETCDNIILSEIKVDIKDDLSAQFKIQYVHFRIFITSAFFLLLTPCRDVAK